MHPLEDKIDIYMFPLEEKIDIYMFKIFSWIILLKSHFTPFND